MHIVWFSWKDEKHPQAGGAETVSRHIRQNLVRDGHNVTLITAQYTGSPTNDNLSGVSILRSGNKFTVYLKARGLYRRLTASKSADLIVDEMNTIPFCAKSYAKGVPAILLTYQLARKVWFYQMIFPLSLVGYLLEPLYLRLLSLRYKVVATESESTKYDLSKYGFKLNNIYTFRVGMDNKPLSSLGTKKTAGKILFLGAMRPMKRPLDAVKAFEYARDDNQGLTLKVAGDTTGPHAKGVINYINRSRHKGAIEVLGRVSGVKKTQLLRDSDVVLVTSSKEGWGLVVTEANSQGTPAIAYNADGLKDSVTPNETGLLADDGDPKTMGIMICELLRDDAKYKYLRKNAFENSKQFTFANSYRDFTTIIEKAIGEKTKN